jgi:hypothetical protein
MLTQFKNELAAEGPPSADKLAKIEDRRRLAALDLDAFWTCPEKWRAPTEEPGGVLWETGTDRRQSFGVKLCGLH